MLLCISGARVGAESPNILLITSEDHSPDIGCYGDKTVPTPHLDALAEQGVLFERAYVPLSVCSPSRACMFTGLYPHQNGQLGLATHGYHTYQGIPNLYQIMKAGGYRTGMIGKLHVLPEQAFPIDFWPIKGSNFGKKDVAGYADYAAKFFAAGEEPFFLMVNYPDAHTPFQSKPVDGLPTHWVTPDQMKVPSYVGVDTPRLRQSIANYYNCLSRLDACMGMMMEALEKSGKCENTLVVWLSDHGSQISRGKVTCYENGLRVPMIVDWPGVDVPHREQRFVSTLDILPTILAATGLELPRKGAIELPGRDLRPLLANKTTDNWRTHVFAEYWPCSRNWQVFHLQQSVRDERFKLIANLHPGPNQVLAGYYQGKHPREVPIAEELAQAPPEVRAGYDTWLAAPPHELYDLENDPYEWTNLAEDPRYAPRLASLKAALEAWREETRDPMSKPELRNRYIEEVTGRQGRGNWSYEEYLDSRRSKAK
jgi:N-sulfoglucosamine sulfohydrolase